MIDALRSVLIMNPDDTVGLCLSDIAAGDPLGNDDTVARDAVPAGHKVAVRAMAKGAPIFKYGQIIGLASQAIKAGEHVHVHNVSHEAKALDTVSQTARPETLRQSAQFQGYIRPDGRVATRNYIGVLTSVNCSATVARKIADSFPEAIFEDQPNIDGVVALTHTTGCGMTPSSDGTANLRRTLDGYAKHANFAGILMVGLGCEMMQIGSLFGEDTGLEQSAMLRTLMIQDEGGTLKSIEKGKSIVREMLTQLGDLQRKTVSAEHLTLGLQCGGSDGWSGVTANPALGRAADRLVAAGGTVILSETPEIYGAEALLFDRAVSDEVRTHLHERLEWWQDYVASNGAELNNNPSPGNIAGGLTTILEKSLGAVAKSGSSPLQAVYRYAQPIDQKGFVFMDSPGYDPCSATGQTASGANILAFTTGRGSVFGSKPAPCIKLASNRDMALRLSEDMDIDCSAVLDGVSLDQMGDAIFQKILDVASGAPSKSEALGLGDLEFVPWQIGAVV
ncbi:MAG: altronate dehydratase family protein [Henriciella sp.]|nr:altronate dehydratase family protein [Henriciella sp.]